MSEQPDYEIVYILRRRLPGEEYSSEIGFGTSGTWASPAGCAHMVSSDIDAYQWETEADMPDPEQIKASVEGGDDD